MRKPHTSTAPLKAKLEKSDYFYNENHDFADKEQQQWVDFSVDATIKTVQLLRNRGPSSKLKTLLLALGKVRFEFAKKVQHIDLKGDNSFGVWRQNNSDTIFGAAAKGEKDRAKGITEISIKAEFVSTPVYVHQELYKHVEENLALTDTLSPAHRKKNLVSDMTNQILIHFMKRRGITLLPIEVFETAKFEQYTFQTTNLSKTVFALTTFYRITNLCPFVIMLEHPHSRIANMLLDIAAQPLYQGSIEGPGSNSVQSSRIQLETTAKFAWYCFQLMPFVRGSAGILQILIAALLINNNIEPKRYSGIRLDIDALSLSQNLFVERFCKDYAFY